MLNVFHAFKGSESTCPQHFGGSPTDATGADPEPNWCWNNYLSHRALLQADNVRNQLKRTMEKFDLSVSSLWVEFLSLTELHATENWCPCLSKISDTSTGTLIRKRCVLT